MLTSDRTIFWTTFWGRLMGKRSPEPVPLSVPYWAGYHIWDAWCDLSLSKWSEMGTPVKQWNLDRHKSFVVVSSFGPRQCLELMQTWLSYIILVFSCILRPILNVRPSSHCLCWCIPLCFRVKRHRMFQNKNNNNDAYSSPSDIFIFLITTAAAAAGALTVLRGNRSETFFYADTV
ncbi:hypothetical protein EDB89DRAFT_1951690 [Lactarius sanguifluus]|nr:hypothetical protein EDB89DRAFT_1951690 [Lactarius sanguifluus]